MTGIIKTDQLQGAQSSTITIPSGNNLTVGGSFTSQGIDDNANAVAITIDTSENVLIGKTNTSFSNAGLRILPTGNVYPVADGSTPLEINRLSSDGDIVKVYKDGTAVGSIGVADGGDRIYLANGGAEGIGIDNGSNAFVPTNGSGAYADNHISLGRSDARWAGIYTSNGLFVGGTGSANQLDDYEEGTFDVTIRDATSGGNTGSVTQTNKYVKIGNKVWMQFNLINITTTGMSANNVLYLTGLPFTPATGSYGSGSVLTNQVNVHSTCFGLSLFQNAGNSYASLIENKDNAGSESTTVAGFDNSTADVFGTMMIEV